MTRARSQAAVQLNESSNDLVVLTTADSDRFIKTQREIVDAMRGAEDMLAKGREATGQFNQMVSDITAWCQRQKNLAACIACPRMDDTLILVVASDEDEDGLLDDAISAIDLEMFARNRFRLTWLMLRSSEAKGIWAFVSPADARLIYRAQ